MPGRIDAAQVCATVLAGGRATRMGGLDKGLQPFRGQALAWHAVQRLQAQTLGTPGLIAINANRNLPLYAAWGCPVWPDTLADFPGPLAGFQTALSHCQEYQPPWEYLLMVPCDSPLFPLNLLERLAQALCEQGADMAMATAAEADRDGVLRPRIQPVFCLLRTRLLPHLQDYLHAGGRKIADWAAQNATAEVPFNTPADDPRAFANTNTLDQLHQLEHP